MPALLSLLCFCVCVFPSPHPQSKILVHFFRDLARGDDPETRRECGAPEVVLEAGALLGGHGRCVRLHAEAGVVPVAAEPDLREEAPPAAAGGRKP